jgi:hypothetical protein
MFSYFMCAYTVLKFNNKYSLLFFSYFMCAYIIVLKFNNKYSLIIMQSQVNKGKLDSLICIFYLNGIK